MAPMEELKPGIIAQPEGQTPREPLAVWYDTLATKYAAVKNEVASYERALKEGMTDQQAEWHKLIDLKTTERNSAFTDLRFGNKRVAIARKPTVTSSMTSDDTEKISDMLAITDQGFAMVSIPVGYERSALGKDWTGVNESSCNLIRNAASQAQELVQADGRYTIPDTKTTDVLATNVGMRTIGFRGISKEEFAQQVLPKEGRLHYLVDNLDLAQTCYKAETARPTISIQDIADF